ncbi:probable glutathione S-transferase [Gastrolobium bilobum]|uniref:probable glutathione S-transferase n=1 Tax=Gastrolobium bilobum TaxID=150636 RepID=UPI002AB03233|nr:probable glutathione S-transferase [Gastrolobium bilobum]
MAASQEEVKLFGVVGSPFVCRAQIALQLKGVEYKFVEEKLNNMSDLLLKYNPVYKKVPVFVHNDKPISESLVIVEYIDETWKHNSILPTEPYQRALARFWSKFIDDKCVAAAWKAAFTVDEKEREKAVEELFEALKFLENELKNKFFGGNEFGLVDIAAVFIPIVQEVAGLQLFTAEKFPKLYKWSQDFHSHPVVKENMPPKDQLFAQSLNKINTSMATYQEEVKLLGIVGSPFVCRVQIALNLKGIEYKYLEEKFDNKSDVLLKYNPVYKKVPVLVHNEKPISESLVILEYIDETWKDNPILPAEPYQRALTRFWSKFIDDKCLAAAFKAAFTLDEKEREKGVEESSEALQFLEDELKDKFFAGEKFGLVDITAVFIAFWIPVVQEVSGLQLFTNEKFPKLYRWSQEFINDPVVKESLPPRELLFAFFKARYESLVASK